MSISGIMNKLDKMKKQQADGLKVLDSKLAGIQKGFAQQVGETRKAVESLGKIIQTLSNSVNKELAKINKKPCMEITEIFTTEEIEILKSKII